LHWPVTSRLKPLAPRRPVLLRRSL